MYLIMNNQRYTVSRRYKTEDTVRYLTVTPAPEVISGPIQMFRDDGFLMSEDNADDYVRKEYTGTLLTLTNVPEPHPEPEPPDTRTAAEKRKAAYSTGYVGADDWHIEYGGERFTCDELSQLGMRYFFRNETAEADQIRTIVIAKIGEIRAAYPDENPETEAPAEEAPAE